MRPNIPEKTGIQENRGYTQTDEFITRTYVLPLLTDEATRKRLIEEHKNNPVGKPGEAGNEAIGHSDDLARVLDKLRRAPPCPRPACRGRCGCFWDLIFVCPFSPYPA